MSVKAIAIHGHFYQPSRVDPITGLIPIEASVSPYHNWNERINADCYRPNAEIGNFEKLSFNIGPTLFSWLETYDPATYRDILAQNQVNVSRFGISNAIAQAFHHTILPLATPSDKMLQTYWGITDFFHRFGHKPRGIWLPETAVDIETLTTLVDYGIEFTILAPWQAESELHDPTEPYRVWLPNGRSISILFFNKELSSLISFNPPSTQDPDEFVWEHLLKHFRTTAEQHGEAQLVLLASDGELYGHHQPSREKFLAILYKILFNHPQVQTTFPALWLKEHPARQIVKIRERTSWSCHHGITRWNGNCDCTPLNGYWKTNLRNAFNRLAASLDEIYFEAVYAYLPRPRRLRMLYIHVLLNQMTIDELITQEGGKTLTSQQLQRVSLLLQAQLERQKMFTSCGWFYEDFDRIETRNNLASAAQAVRLTHLATGIDLAAQAMADLHVVVSPKTHRGADTIFKQHLDRAYQLDKKVHIPN